MPCDDCADRDTLDDDLTTARSRIAELETQVNRLMGRLDAIDNALNVLDHASENARKEINAEL